MNRFRTAGLAGTLVAAMALPGAAQERPRVLATVGMLADMVDNLSDGCAEVEALMGPGIDPHLYQPTAADVARLQQADAILYVGLGLEGRLGAILGRLGADRATLGVGEGLDEGENLIRTDDAYGVDPHIWMDVALWARAIPAVSGFLGDLGCAAAPEGYAGELAALDDWVRSSIASIPPEQRALVTAHDAFGYFARAYDIQEVSLQGISTETETSIADIRDTADLVAARQVPAVFVESTINPRSIEALRAALRDRGHEVALGGTLYSDAMGETGTPEGTYIGMIRANTIRITEALGGTPAPWPDALGPWAAGQGLGNP
ncbi:metal ABC transporter solute-binding protein, Zn/Mn family [Halodurantibacterium flavum]|uniref:Metal ABC transporter solute-binding protein, Zn/Mn family n=1 Tax=Halodurantibacterium flavum TaxID=1382802 RepID=A0ABW4SBT8_9RHOB